MKIKNAFKNYFNDLKRIPTIMFTLFCLTIVIMNILANKTIFQNDLIAIDGGIVVTWIVVIIMDLVVTIYGPKTSIRMSVFAIIVSLLVSLVFYLVSLIPSTKDFGEINKVLGGTWFIILSGATAFILSSSLNAALNWLIGTLFKKQPKSKAAIFLRCNVSTLISQIFDNFVFNCLAFMVFAPIFWNNFHWTPLQCIMCALVYGAIEIIIEIFLFPIIYKIYTKLSKSDN